MVTLFVTLTLALLAIRISCQVQEEIESLGANLLAGLCLLLSVVFAPVYLKVLMLCYLLATHWSVSLKVLQESRNLDELF